MLDELKDKRIFIIEDNLGNRAIMQLLLEQRGAIVSFERWGIDMIARLAKFKPVDLILLDLMFPSGVTGYDICDTIRSHNEYINIPIVAVSASEPAVSIPKVKAKGFQGFITKPISFDEFPKQIGQLLAGYEVWET